MMSKELGLNRTARPRWNIYETDGLGRDTYISYNNGGFWGREFKPITLKPNYPIYHNHTYHTLKHNAAPFKYYSDGSGRDSYITVNDGGLRYDHQALSKYHLKDFLRTPESCVFNFQSNPMKEGVRIKTHYVSKNEMNHNKGIRNIEKGLITRLYTEGSEKMRTNTSNQPRRAYNPFLRVHPVEYPRLRTESNYIETIKNDNDVQRTKEKVMKLDSFELGGDNNHTNDMNKTRYNSSNPKDSKDNYYYRATHTVNDFFPKKKKKINNICLTTTD